MILKTDCGLTFKLGKGKPLGNVPSTYKFVKHILFFKLGGRYNSSLCTMYKNRQGVLKYEIYRDGCFYPYYGTLTQIVN